MKCRADELNVGDVVIWDGKEREIIRSNSVFWTNRQSIRFNHDDFEEFRIIFQFDSQGKIIDNSSSKIDDGPWIGNTVGHFLKEHIFEVVDKGN